MARCTKLTTWPLGLRTKGQYDVHKVTGKRSYKINRWRLGSQKKTTDSHSTSPTPTQNDSKVHLIGNERPQDHLQLDVRPRNNGSISREMRAEIVVSPAQGHLLTLIQHNVLRGLMGNKHALARFTKHFIYATQDRYIGHSYPGFAATLPLANPSSFLSKLYPTKSQIETVHSTWIDFIPFPRMRDNLIKWEAYFDHAELARDLIGNLVDPAYFCCTAQPLTHLETTTRTVGRNLSAKGEQGLLQEGFIVWDEPQYVESWEVTPGFLWKWTWTLEGCQDLITATNHWRLSRGEAPLALPT